MSYNLLQFTLPFYFVSFPSPVFTTGPTVKHLKFIPSIPFGNYSTNLFLKSSTPSTGTFIDPLCKVGPSVTILSLSSMIVLTICHSSGSHWPRPIHSPCLIIYPSVSIAPTLRLVHAGKSSTVPETENKTLSFDNPLKVLVHWWYNFYLIFFRFRFRPSGRPSNCPYSLLSSTWSPYHHLHHSSPV